MAFILEAILTGWIEPFLWFKSMSALHKQKSKKRCFRAFLFYYMLIVCKQIISNYIEKDFVRLFLMIAMELYVICVTVFLFEGYLHEKIISIFAFYGILSASEIIVIESCVIMTHMDLDTVLQNENTNFICGFMVMLLQSILCYCFFDREKVKQIFYRNKERFAFIIIACVMLICLLSRKSVYVKQSNTIFLLDIVWLLFLWNIFSFLLTLKKKDTYIVRLKQEIHNSMERNKLVNNIDRFKHNYSINMFIMKNLFCHRQYDVLGTYMDKAFQDIEKAQLLFYHSNITIRILVSRFMQTAKEMRIPLSVRILVQEFGMEDEDICSVLQNLISNGLEAAAKMPYNMARVSLQVLPTEEGYVILCSNKCSGIVDFNRTSKLDQTLHGYGVGIVDKIVKKYNGTITRQCKETKEAGIGRVVVTIKITR